MTKVARQTARLGTDRQLADDPIENEVGHL
jgi:hypothetical protein